MTEFRPGQPPDQAHLALKSALETMEKAKQCAVLWFGEILERKLYQDLGYTKARVVASVRVSLEMSPTQFARYEALWEKIGKQRDVPADRTEALLAIMAAFTAESSPRGELAPSAQIHIHQCPDCEEAVVQTGKGELEQAECDCQTHRPSP